MLTSSARLRGLAANPALAPALLDRFVAAADAELCLDLAERDDLTSDQVRLLAARGGADAAIRLVYRGLLASGDVDPTDPWIGLALLDADANADRDADRDADGGGAPSGLAALAQALASDPDPKVREALARTERLPDDVLARLAADQSTLVAAAAASSVRLTAGLATTLAHHPHLEVRRALAGNECTPAAVLATLVEDGGRPPARWCAGCDGRADPLPGMQCDGGHEVARGYLDAAIARNPTTASRVVSLLADHPVLSVRWAVASRPDLPPDAARRLAHDPMPITRAGVAANPAIDAMLIRRLAADPAAEVRRGVADNPLVSLDVLAEVARTTRIGPVLLPRIAGASAAEVAELARSALPELRMLVAQRPQLPLDLMDALAVDADAKVLGSVASQPALTAAQLRSILDGHGGRVAAAVAANPSCPAELLTELAHREPPVRRALRRIAAHPHATAPALLRCLRDDRARPIAARHPALPPDEIARLLDHPDERVVEEAAANPALPAAVMASLLLPL